MSKYLVNKKLKKIFNGIIPRYEKNNVYEIVTSDYGTAIKYNDGRMECYGTIHDSSPTTGVWGAYNYVECNVTFPAIFKEKPTIVANSYANSGMYFTSVGSDQSLTTSKCLVRLMSVQNISVNDAWFTYRAVGKWK